MTNYPQGLLRLNYLFMYSEEQPSKQVHQPLLHHARFQFICQTFWNYTVDSKKKIHLVLISLSFGEGAYIWLKQQQQNQTKP